MRVDSKFSKKIELKQATVFLRTDKIIHIHIKADADMELNDAVMVMEAMGRIGEGRKYPILIDAGEYVHIGKEVRSFSASKEANIFTRADAIVYHSLAQKLLADFYILHNKPVVPTKCFPSTEKAVAWLLKDEKDK